MWPRGCVIISPTMPDKDWAWHIAEFRVAPEVCVGMGQVGHRHYWVDKSAIPNDAKIVGARYDDKSRVFVILLEHPSFPAVLPGLEAHALRAPEMTTCDCTARNTRYAETHNGE